jgi:hypothetical protein
MQNDQKTFIDGLRVQIEGRDLLLVLAKQGTVANYHPEKLVEQLTSLADKGIVVWVHARPDGTLQDVFSTEWKEKIEALKLKASDFKKIPCSPG